MKEEFLYLKYLQKYLLKIALNLSLLCAFRVTLVSVMSIGIRTNEITLLNHILSEQVSKNNYLSDN